MNISKDLIQYEKILTLNDESFENIQKCNLILLNFVKENCKLFNEDLQYFQINLTDSEKNPFAKDLKIKWAVTKN